MEQMGIIPPENNDDNLDEFIDKLAGEIVSRHLAAPAIMLLESSKPLTFVGSQTLVFCYPFFTMLGVFKDRDKYIRIFEDRDKVEKLIQAIEKCEDEKISNRKKVNQDGENQ